MSTATSLKIQTLIETIKTTFAAHTLVNDAVGLEIAGVLSRLQGTFLLKSRPPKNHSPIIPWFETALAAGTPSTEALLKAIAPVVEYLPWRYSYPPRADAPQLGGKIAFAEIVGPKAPFPNESVCLGLTLIAPETLYPAHHHPAIELYFVVAGTAIWTLNGVSQDNPPGTFLLHPSHGIHAMQTRREPLLAVYTWSGKDVFTTSAYLPASQSGPSSAHPHS